MSGGLPRALFPRLLLLLLPLPLPLLLLLLLLYSSQVRAGQVTSQDPSTGEERRVGVPVQNPRARSPQAPSPFLCSLRAVAGYLVPTLSRVSDRPYHLARTSAGTARPR